MTNWIYFVFIPVCIRFCIYFCLYSIILLASPKTRADSRFDLQLEFQWVRPSFSSCFHFRVCFWRWLAESPQSKRSSPATRWCLSEPPRVCREQHLLNFFNFNLGNLHTFYSTCDASHSAVWSAVLLFLASFDSSMFVSSTMIILFCLCVAFPRSLWGLPCLLLHAFYACIGCMQCIHWHRL